MPKLTAAFVQKRTVDADCPYMGSRSIGLFLAGAASAVTGLVITYGTDVGNLLCLATYLTLCVAAGLGRWVMAPAGAVT